MACEEDGGVVWKETNNTLMSDSGTDIWDDSALIKAYDTAIAQLKGDIPTPTSDEKQTGEVKQRKKKKKNKKSNKKAGTAFVNYPDYGNEEEVEIEKLLPIEMKAVLQTSHSIDLSDPQGVSVSGKPRKKTKKSSNSKKTCNWSVSDICYAPNEKNEFKQAVVNSFIDSSKCNVTFITDRTKREIPIYLLQSKPMTWTPDGRKETTSPSQSPWNVLSMHPTLQPSTFSPMMFSGGQPPSPFAGNYPDWQNTLHGRLNPSFRAPPFPPPPTIPSNVIDGDEEALANMLMSWYMSGYHTGYYQGTRESRVNKQSLDPNRNRPSEFSSNASVG